MKNRGPRGTNRPPAPSGSLPLGGDLSGTASSATVAKIQGRAVSTTAPSDGQLLRWDGEALHWVPFTIDVSGRGGAIYGDGNAGDVTIPDDTGDVPLEENLVAQSATIGTGCRILPSNFDITIAGTLDLAGTLDISGADAVGATGGVATAAGSHLGGTSGADGGTGAGSNGVSPSSAVRALAHVAGSHFLGGMGGASGVTAGGINGRYTAAAATDPSFHELVPALSSIAPNAAYLADNAKPPFIALSGGTGGGAGAGDGSQTGGGSGAGGGLHRLAARHIVLRATARIKGKGGVGGAASAGNAAGGGGGGGGLYRFICDDITFGGRTYTAADGADAVRTALVDGGFLDLSGGTGGAGHGTGAAGDDGTDGWIDIFFN